MDLRSATLLNKRLWHSCFPVNFAKFLRTPFLTDHLWWMLLYKPISILPNLSKIYERLLYKLYTKLIN